MSLNNQNQESYQIISQRIQNAEIQNGIAEIFSHYRDNLQDILTLATVESNGVRPEGLSNEIYSCFHHISRALSSQNADIKQELKSAQHSHLKRAILDSYKIAINAFLEQEAKFRELIDYFILVDNFVTYMPDGVIRVKAIKNLSRAVKEYYKDAKNHEMLGEFDKAIESFKNSIEKCYMMRDSLNEFIGDKTFVFALAQEAKRARDAKHDRRMRVLIPILTAVLAFFFANLSNIISCFSDIISNLSR